MIRQSIQALLVIFFCGTGALKGQSTGAPDGIVFQAIATDANGHPASDKNVYVKDAILSRSATGQVVYAESFIVRSNKDGIFTITLGKGSRSSGATGLSNIDWSAGPFFLNLKVAIGNNDDWEGNANSRNFVDMGTTQFWSVPYALYAGKVEGLDVKLNVTDTAAMLRPYYRTAKLAPALALKEDVINKSTDGRLGNSDLLYPTQKAVKAYVDAHSGGGGSSLPISFGPISISSYVNGGTISGTNIISLSPADAVNSGVVNAGTQVFGGDKGFVKDIKVNGLTVGKGNSSIPSNTVFGFQALSANTSGQNNTVLGYGGLQYNTTGFSNTSTGFSSLQYNTTGYENTANGIYALQYNTTGAANTALGYGALSRNFTGIGNTSVGHQSLLGLKDGSGNTAIGVNSMVYGISGNDNTALGNGSLYGNNTGDRNTAIGTGTLYKNTLGTNNMASGYYSLFYNSTGIGNAAFGVFSMQNNITGNSNTALGYFADVATDGLNNATAIGNGAIVAASNSIQLGNDAVTSLITKGKLTTGAVTYPNTDGSAGQVLTTDGAGTALWTSAGGAFVPFSGATQAVNLGAYDLTVNNLTIGKGTGNIISNTAVGDSSLLNNTTGHDNTATGYQTLSTNTTGLGNTADGSFTLQYNTEGSHNTALGLAALRYNTTGTRNTAVGSLAFVNNITGEGNTAVGFQTLLSNFYGIGNTAIGLNSMVYASGGNNNTAIGSGTLYSNNTGDWNTALGAGALGSNLTGFNNISSGFQSMNFNTSGYEDVAYGIGSLYNNIDGYRNSASGSFSMFNNASGNNNVAFGYYSLKQNINGHYNTALGNEADVATDGLTNATAIGNGAIVAASNSIQLGNTSVTSVQTSGSFYAGGILLTSDKRLKQNITPLQNSLATILKLNPVHYQKRSSLNSSDYSKTENGFIAQEVQQTVPYIVKEGNDKDHLLSVDYVSLIPLLTKAIQEQQAQISKQSEDIKALKKLVEQLMQKK